MTAPYLPGYTYIEPLGAGGFADVYLYEQEWPRQRVAVKVVRPDIPITDREKELFAAEADAMAELADHPYIVSVLTAGVTEDDGRPYLVMRYCPPPDLGVRVRSNPLSVADALSTGIKLAAAIETAHRAGILHRDIKPSNVLVTAYHQPAITDFGIAGHIQEVAGESDVRISYPWSPPELLDGRSNGAFTSDVYSLGATIWHLLVGRSPFSVPGGDNSTRALSTRILHSPPPLTGRADVPAALDRLLQQCLSKRPQQRPQSALQLAQALQRVEGAIGLPRTDIAVERGSTRQHRVTGPADDSGADLQQVKVLQAGDGPRHARPAQDDPTDRSSRASMVWGGVAAVAAAALVVALVTSNRGGPSDPAPAPVPTLSQDPGLGSGVLGEKPIVTQRINGPQVTFSWRTGGSFVSGDTWQVTEYDMAGNITWAGKSRAEMGKRVVRTKGQPVCLVVSQVRGTSKSSPAQSCSS